MAETSDAKKRQHYVDQALQRNFLEKEQSKLWVYDRTNKQYRHQHPSQIALEGHLYSLDTPELQEQRYIIEGALQKLEDKALPVLAKLRAGESITNTERNYVCEYAGFQYVRTPEHLEMTKELGQRAAQFMIEELARQLAEMPAAEYAERMAKYRGKAGIDRDIPQSEWKSVLKEKRISAKQPPDYHKGMMIEVGTDVALGFSKKHWIILHTKPGRSFIGSDVPIIQMPTPGAMPFRASGPLADGMVNYFPFAKDAALLIQTDENRVIDHATVNDKGLHKFNANLALDSRRVIFSGSRQLLEATVSRSGLDHIETRFIFKDEYIRGQMRGIVSKFK